MIRFNRSNLPFTNQMKDSWDDNGFLIIENFYTSTECDKLRDRANFLVKNLAGRLLLKGEVIIDFISVSLEIKLIGILIFLNFHWV